MSLVPAYDDSSSSSSSEDSEEPPSHPEEAPKPKLPAPNFMGNTFDDPDKAKSSVFKNPFAEAENAKEAVLQKHVKMVNAKDVVVINGKKICWNYRKGRCRFGHNCKFAHDSDLQKSKTEADREKAVQQQQSVVCQNRAVPEPSPQELEKIMQESVALNQQKRKKRPGLSQGLVPGKKVMKNYMKRK